VTPPPITEPVVMYEAIRTYHEWGPWTWTTDGYGTVLDGTPPSPLMEKLFIAALATPVAILIGLVLLVWIIAALRFLGSP